MADTVRLSRRALVALPVALLCAMVVAVWPQTVTSTFSGQYLPHGVCYLWNKQLLALHVTSDVVIWLSYVAIAVTLTWIAYKNRREIPFGWMFGAFGLF